jgi:hypothetical protein
MILQQFGIVRKAMEFFMEKIITNLCVICKLHNVCMDHRMMNHPTAVHVGCFLEFSDLEASPRSF